ncbi:MAG TPA: Zn-ribbon domain-containing OB-fold protein [Thermoprotei archaeon]|nr:Zn-ribbon domain-containing OB-fold protein [Thermoprotei archaeon]
MELPIIPEIARTWRIRYQRYRLEGTRCKKCGKIHYPPRLVCNNCHSTDLEPYRLSGEGEVVSYTIVNRGSTGFNIYTPYVYAVVRLKEGVLVEGQMTDVSPSDIRIGMPVEVVVRKLLEYGKDGLIIYGYKFRPKIK